MNTETTYELEIAFIGPELDNALQKEFLTAWLVGRGFDTFLHGVVDNPASFPP